MADFEYERRATEGEILRAIGNLEGKIDAIHQMMGNNRADIIEAFRRLRAAEERIAQGVGIAIALSILMPILVTMLNPRLHFNQPQQHSSYEHRVSGDA